MSTMDVFCISKVLIVHMAIKMFLTLTGGCHGAYVNDWSEMRIKIKPFAFLRVSLDIARMILMTWQGCEINTFAFKKMPWLHVSQLHFLHCFDTIAFSTVSSKQNFCSTLFDVMLYHLSANQAVHLEVHLFLTTKCLRSATPLICCGSPLVIACVWYDLYTIMEE